MSLDNTTPAASPGIGGGGGGDGDGPKKTSALKPPEQTLNCPRCDSPNTKFCYYNNYSLTQPRYFCKTCRRYWTKGGALRNVPIGGGCRKKKPRSSRFINGNDPSSKDTSLEAGALSLFTGLSPPAMDFQLGGINQFPSSSNYNPPSFKNLDSLRFNFPIIKQDQLHGSGLGLPTTFQESGHNLASSIESLSCINQDLHWKLQQQRLAVLLGETEQQNQPQKLQPMFFQNLEIPKPSQTNSLETEWFIDGNFEAVNAEIGPSSTDELNYENGNMNNWNNGWNQYSVLP